MVWYKLFGFVEKMFVLALPLFSCNALKYVSMNNQECTNKSV